MQVYHDISKPPRTLGIALAHCFAVCRAGRDTERLEQLNKLFAKLKPADQIACRWELLQCQRAVRGETFATFAVVV
jgi:hypothetical protein